MKISKIFYGVGYLWLLPVTLFGLLFQLILGGKFKKLDERLVFHFIADPNSLYRKMNAGKFVSTTIGATIIYIEDYYYSNETIKIHENTHVNQGIVLGIFEPILYLISSWYCAGTGKDSYRENWFEKQAYRAQLGTKSLWLWQ